MGGLLSFIPGEGTYTNLGDTGGFFSSYLQQPSDTQASLFRKSASQFLSMFSFGAAPLNVFTYKLGRANEASVLGSVWDIFTKTFYQSKMVLVPSMEYSQCCNSHCDSGHKRQL